MSFLVRVQEGTYSQEFSVCVDADAFESFGHEAIEAAAKREWRRRFGPSLGMAYFSVKVLSEACSF